MLLTIIIPLQGSGFPTRFRCSVSIPFFGSVGAALLGLVYGAVRFSPTFSTASLRPFRTLPSCVLNHCCEVDWQDLTRLLPRLLRYNPNIDALVLNMRDAPSEPRPCIRLIASEISASRRVRLLGIDGTPTICSSNVRSPYYSLQRAALQDLSRQSRHWRLSCS